MPIARLVTHVLGIYFVVTIQASIWAQAPIEVHPTNDPRLNIEVIARGMPIPTTIAFSPDGRLFFLERETGNVRVFDRHWVLQPKPVITIPIAYHRNEAGAMSLAIAPIADGSDTRIYVSHVTAEDTWSISRFVEDGTGRGNQLERVMDFPDCVVGEVESTRWHNINSLHFGPNIISDSPERLLYISFGDGGGIKPTGEPSIEDPAQDPGSWCGGLFWIDPDNPPQLDEGETHNVCVGLRNSYDFCFHPKSRTIYMTENGFNSYDEVNQIRVGGNHGWPVVVGKGEDPRFVDPIFQSVWVTAPTGICVYPGGPLPDEYENQVMFCEWGQGEIRVLDLENPSDPKTEARRDYYLLGHPDIFNFKPVNGWGFIDMTPGPDGAIYLSAAPGAGPGVTGAILRIVRSSEAREPFVGIRAY